MRARQIVDGWRAHVVFKPARKRRLAFDQLKGQRRSNDAMWKRLYAALFILALVAAPHVRAQAAGAWIKFSPAAGGFSISMPAQPKEETSTEKEFA